MRPKLIPAATAAALTLTLAACGSGPQTEETAAADTGYPLTVANCGEEVTIEAAPEAVLTIGHSAVALLDAAGATDRIVARSGEFSAPLPEGLQNPPDDVEVVDPADPAAETIIGTGADIVVGYGLFTAAPEALEAAGIPNLVVAGECNHDGAVVEAIGFDSVFADIERYGEVFGTQEAAAASVEDFQAELSELEAQAAAETQTVASVYYWSASSTMSAHGGLSMAHDVLGRANLENVYAAEQSAYFEASVETLLDADPQVIVLSYGGYGESFEDAKAQLLAEPGAADLQAVRNDRIIGVGATDLNPDQGALRGLETVIAGAAA
ncbi:ABC transporter substrate-binding protein [Glycomyces sp. NPDC048151]|uniref:ABC transporter substrate-binding protein n=1 Tax=Glycomyces sp. NPDC048151 TaxID=3364002 RepID=UPI003721C4B7